MFLIPLGHEHDSTRRIPWVTFAILGLCVLAFALTGFGSWNSPTAAAERNERALTYFMERPYLALRPDVEKEILGADLEANQVTIAALRESHPTPSPEVVAREQAELDRRMAGAFGHASVDPFQRFGLVPAHPSAVGWVTHLFLHGGWLHLLGNLFLLYLVGPFLEDVWGRPLFAAFYLVGGVLASAAFVLLYGSLEAPLIGASGAIAALMGAFLVRYRTTRVHFFYLVGFWMRGTFWAPAWVMLGLWFADQAFLASVAHGATGSGSGGVAYLVHVAGFAFGALGTLGLAKVRAEERVAPAIEAKISRPVVTRPALERALEAREVGNLEGAMTILRKNLAENPGDRDTVLALWDVAVARGSAAEVAPAMKGVVRGELRDGELDLAAQHWVELIKVSPTTTLDTGSLLKMVPPLADAGRRDDALAVLRRAVLTAGTSVPFATALRIATVGAPLDPRLARSILQLVLARPNLDPTEREQAEKAMASIVETPVAVEVAAPAPAPSVL